VLSVRQDWFKAPCTLALSKQPLLNRQVTRSQAVARLADRTASQQRVCVNTEKTAKHAKDS